MNAIAIHPEQSLLPFWEDTARDERERAGGGKAPLARAGVCTSVPRVDGLPDVVDDPDRAAFDFESVWIHRHRQKRTLAKEHEMTRRHVPPVGSVLDEHSSLAGAHRLHDDRSIVPASLSRHHREEKPLSVGQHLG